jgi:hypothetical protein
MTNFIWITTQKEMFHKYPNAPDAVSFLRNEHRHIFKFKVYVEVVHNDRDIEFIMFKHEVETMINQLNKNLKHKSCEMISNDLFKSIIKQYPNRHIKIEVSEDGENGSLYDYPTNQ